MMTTPQATQMLYAAASQLLCAAETRQLFKKPCLLTNIEAMTVHRDSASLQEYVLFHERVGRLGPRLRKALLGSGMQGQGRLATALAGIWARLGLQGQHCQFIAWLGETFNLFLPLTEPERLHLWAGQPYHWEVNPPYDLPRFLAQQAQRAEAEVATASTSIATTAPQASEQPPVSPALTVQKESQRMAESLATLGQRLDRLDVRVDKGQITPREAQTLSAEADTFRAELSELLQAFGLDPTELEEARGLTDGTLPEASHASDAAILPVQAGTIARNRQLSRSKQQARRRKPSTRR